MTTTLSASAATAEVSGNDYGTDESRVKFLRYLNQDQRFSLNDIAKHSMHSVDSVKAWLSNNPKRYRSPPDRALKMILNSLNLTEQDYWTLLAAIAE